MIAIISSVVIGSSIIITALIAGNFLTRYDWRDPVYPERYKILQLSAYRRDQYMIDSATGKIWQSTCMVSSKSSDDCEYSAWKIRDVEGITAEYSTIKLNAEFIESNLKGRTK